MSYAGPTPPPSRAEKTAELVRGALPLSGPIKPRPPIGGFAGTEPDASRKSAFTAGLVLGLAIGAGIALLVAPQTGADVRRSIARRGARLRRRGRDAWIDLADELQLMRRRRAQRNALSRREASSL